MFKIGHGVTRICQGLTRREILQVGGLGFLGLTLGEWFGVKSAFARSADATAREQSCIFIFLSGGPSHFETFDPKPAAPVEIRGPYASIPTSVSGIRISELLPQIARQMDKCALIRSMVTVDMHAGTYVVSGGHRGNASMGAVLQHLQGVTGRGMPPFVHVGPNGYLPGGGSLGTTFNPLIVNDPSRTVSLPEFTLTANVTPGRFQDRRCLLRAVDDVRARAYDNPGITDMDANYRRAVDLLTSDRVRAAFDVSRENDEVRTRSEVNRSTARR